MFSYISNHVGLITAVALYQQRSVDIFGQVIPLPIQNLFAKSYLGDFASRVLYLCIDFMDEITSIALVGDYVVITTKSQLKSETIKAFNLTEINQDSEYLGAVKSLYSGERFPQWEDDNKAQQFYLLDRLGNAYYLAKSPYPLDQDGELNLADKGAVKALSFPLPSFCYTQGAFVLLKRPDYINLPNVINLEVGQTWQDDEQNAVTILLLMNDYVVFEVTHAVPAVLTKEQFQKEYITLKD